VSHHCLFEITSGLNPSDAPLEEMRVSNRMNSIGPCIGGMTKQPIIASIVQKVLGSNSCLCSLNALSFDIFLMQRSEYTTGNVAVSKGGRTHDGLIAKLSPIAENDIRLGQHSSVFCWFDMDANKSFANAGERSIAIRYLD